MHIHGRKHGVQAIIAADLPGPMGFYLAAVVVFEKGPDKVIPLHNALHFDT